jgi:hypothetical protein
VSFTLAKQAQNWKSYPEITDDHCQVSNDDSFSISVQPLIKVGILDLTFSARKAQKENVIHSSPKKPLPGSFISIAHGSYSNQHFKHKHTKSKS